MFNISRKIFHLLSILKNPIVHFDRKTTFEEILENNVSVYYILV